MRTDIENWESMASVREKINALWKTWRRYELSWDAAADLPIAKEVYADYVNWWNPVILYNWTQYVYWYESWWIIRFVALNPQTNNYSTWYSYSNLLLIRLAISDWTVTSVDFSYNIWISPRVLATNVNYTTPYTPAYPWSPATKKYVDDKVPNDGTTWQVLTKTETWSEWKDPSWWWDAANALVRYINHQPLKTWKDTETNYNKSDLPAWASFFVCYNTYRTPSATNLYSAPTIIPIKVIDDNPVWYRYWFTEISPISATSSWSEKYYRAAIYTSWSAYHIVTWSAWLIELY